MLQVNSSSNEIHSDILSLFVKIAEKDITSNEPLLLQDTNMSEPPHIDIGCEPKSSRSKKSDSGCLEGDRAGSLHSPKLTLSCSLISVISSSSMLEEPNPPSYHTLQSSQDTDGGTSMARHLMQVADSGAQDNNKFPSNIYNHNDSLKLTNKSTTMDDLDEEQKMKRSATPNVNTHIPTDDMVSASDYLQCFEIVENYKRSWGIPLQCKLVGGGESTLNSNNTGPISNSANNNLPSSATPGSNNNNSNWPAGHNPASAGVGGNAWNAVGNGNSSGGRQQVGSNAPSNNASHPSNTSQNSGKGGSNSGSQNQPSGQSQPTSTVATSWAQAAGKNLPPSSAASNSSPGTNASTSTTANSANAVNNMSPNSSGNNSNANNNNSKQQIEDFKSMRDSLFATDGWGGQHVNQDSTWDVPSSPEPAPTKDGSSNAATSVPWKPNVNNGTDLWEANLRNGGQPPPQTTQKTPWGHTPSTNIGGTWGEDDDGESSNVWSGSSASVVANPGVQQWGSTPSNPTPMWGNNKKDEWNAGSGWNDPRELPRAGNGIDPRNNMVDSSHMRTVMDHRTISDSMIRGDPRGMSGRINGSNSADPMWGGPPPQQPPGPGPHHHVTPAGPPPGPPAQASKMVPPGPTAGGNSKVSHWKEMGPVGASNLGRTGMQCPPGPTMPQNRLNTSGLNNAAAAAVAAGIKPDQLWPHSNRNGAWGENNPHDMNSTWTEDKMGPWSEPSLGSWNSSQKPKTPMTPGGWTDGEVDPAAWGHVSKMGPKNLTKEIVWASKQFRILSEMNFKKDDIENALRASGMNLEDALEFLNATRAGSAVNNMDGWRRHDIDASPFDHTTNQAYPSHRFNPQQQLPFAVPPGGNGGGNGANTPNISSLNPAMVKSILTQQPPPQPTSIPSFNQASRTTQNQPSAHQLRTLVQQIQMAVSAGYLNHQILNQTLAPTTLILLNSLLQQIKTLQQLQQQATQQSMYPGGQGNKSGAYMALTVKQQQCKQAIQTLQNQIVATQAVYMKQQQQPQHSLGAPSPQGANVNDLFKPQDPVSMLQTNFSDLSFNKDPQMLNAGLQNQSKLSQWKLSNTMDKEDLSCNEFSRAPGTTTKNTSASGSPNLNPILVQSDSTWSSVSNRCDGWPEPVNELDNKDWGSPPSAATNFTDLVPEFEPGKPWKGSQMKSVEDDPNITPGSVVRSPLLSLPTMKDADIFSTTSNTTTSFENNESNGVYSPIGKVNNGNSSSSKTGWGEVNPQAGAVSDLWGGVTKSRGPPPGLTTSKSSSQIVSGATSNSNGWGSLGSPRWSMGNSQTWMGSSWLLLRNLTPQIDGSTLKTLCMQHGPLNNFHLFLNHGIALAKYSTRDEASKAQGALNSCVLGNTTIFAESPAENEVHALLQQLNQQSTSGNNNWPPRSGNNNQNKPMQNSANAGSIQTPSDAWSSSAGSSQLWPSALWGTPPSGLETPDPHRATPSSLNSFLPGDLLGGESM